jgi:hypothetical protein
MDRVKKIGWDERFGGCTINIAFFILIIRCIFTYFRIFRGKNYI